MNMTWKVPLRKPAHVQARLKFTKDHLNDPEESWEDETKIEHFGLDSNQLVWRKNGEFLPNTTIPTA